MKNDSIKILIIDDDSTFSRKFCSILEGENFTVVKKALSKNEFIKQVQEIMPTIILFDNENIDNARFYIYSLINSNKNLYQIPYAIISNEYNLQHHIEALELGANDYFEKSINTKLLSTRIKSLVTKYATLYSKKEITIGAVTINQASRIVYKNGQVVHLINREYQILTFLANNPDCVFTQSQVLEKILGAVPHIKNNAVSVYVCAIRSKLGLNQLVTIKGGGYKLELNKK